MSNQGKGKGKEKVVEKLQKLQEEIVLYHMILMVAML